MTKRIALALFFSSVTWWVITTGPVVVPMVAPPKAKAGIQTFNTTPTPTSTETATSTATATATATT